MSELEKEMGRQNGAPVVPVKRVIVDDAGIRIERPKPKQAKRPPPESPSEAELDAALVRSRGVIAASLKVEKDRRRARKIRAVAEHDAAIRGKTIPTEEREQHDPVELARDREGRPLAFKDDRSGEIGTPNRIVSLLARLERSGRITTEQADGGENFRDDFDRANLNQLRAADLSKPFVDGKSGVDLSKSAIDARRRLDDAMAAVGGYQSVAGSCLYHVVGMGMTLKQWAIFEAELRHRRCSEEAASGILVAMLDALASHYRGVNRSRRRFRSERYA